MKKKLMVTGKHLVSIPCRVCGAATQQMTQVCLECSHKVMGVDKGQHIEFYEVANNDNRWNVQKAYLQFKR